MYSKKKDYRASGPPETFTALITKPDGSTRRLPQSKIWNGVLVSLLAVGKGKKTEFFGKTAEGEGESWEEWEYYAYVPQPLFCTAKMTIDQQKEIKRVDAECEKKKDWSECFERFRDTMFVMGDNSHGYTVEDETASVERKVRENRIATLRAGFRGLKIAERLPPEVWERVRPHATFYKRGDIAEWFEDMDDFHMVDLAGAYSGWNYSAEVVAILSSMGWTVLYRDRPVTGGQDIARVDAEFDEEEGHQRQQRQQRKEEQDALLARYKAALGEWEYMVAGDTKAISELPGIEIKMLNWDGRHLYGVGHWGKMDDVYLYKINQNGHDGDDWSRNNSVEGIVWRTPVSSEIRAVIGQMLEFEKNDSWLGADRPAITHKKHE